MPCTFGDCYKIEGGRRRLAMHAVPTLGVSGKLYIDNNNLNLFLKFLWNSKKYKTVHLSFEGISKVLDDVWNQPSTSKTDIDQLQMSLSKGTQNIMEPRTHKSKCIILMLEWWHDCFE